MAADSASPPEQRLLAALYTASGCALMLLFVWHQLDPDGPTEAFQRARERVAGWRRDRLELIETLEQIQGLPETEPEAPCEGR